MLTIRPIDKKDFKEMEELYTSSIMDNKEGFIQRLDLLKNIKDFIISTKEDDGEFFIALWDNKIVGMGGLAKIDGNKAEICKLHVKKEYKGRKIGEKLFDSIISYAKENGIVKIILHVTKTQKAAINLYKKKNFLIFKDEVCKVNLGGEEFKYDTLFMEKNLI